MPAPEPEVVRETAASLVIDGRDGHGHYAARWGMRRLLEKAAEQEICRASFRRIQHMGRLGEYAEMAAREGFIGIVLYGGSGSCTLPYGGAEGALGTNPIAAGIPTAEGPPFVLDYATSRIAISKALLARSRGQPLPDRSIVDRDGNPSDDPEAYFDGGNLPGFGGHKGYALSLLVGLLCGLSGDHEAGEGRIVGHVMLVMNVDGMTPLAPLPGGRAGLSRPRQVDAAGPRLRRGDRSRRLRAPQPGRAPARRHRDPAPYLGGAGGVRAHPRSRARRGRCGAGGRGPLPRLTVRELRIQKETRRWNTGEWDAPASRFRRSASAP